MSKKEYYESSEEVSETILNFKEENPLKECIKDFLEENKNGTVELLYPNSLQTGGIKINHHNIDNERKIKFTDMGVMIRQTLGYSLVTGKHLFLPYGQCIFIFKEDSDD